MSRITLTQYDSGLPVEIDPQIIVAITRLPACHHRMAGDLDDIILRERTLIDGSIGAAAQAHPVTWEVQETLDEIREAIATAIEVEVTDR